MPYVVGETRTTLVTLTERGRDVLEAARRAARRTPAQAFYAGISKPANWRTTPTCIGAYLRAAERLGARGGRVRRVVLDEELKRDYQRFLQAPNRRRRDSDGRPDRSAEEVAHWAREHELPYERRTTCSSLTFASSTRSATARARSKTSRSRRRIIAAPMRRPRPGPDSRAIGRPAHGCGGGGSGREAGGRGYDPRLAEELLRMTTAERIEAVIGVRASPSAKRASS